MTPYTGSDAPEWLLSLSDDMLSADFVNEAVRRALVEKMLAAAPTTATDEPGVSQLAADLTIATKSLPNRKSRATDDSYHDVCQEVSLSLFGHFIGSYTSCETVLVTSTDDLPPTAFVRLRLAPPPASVAGSSVPTWVATVAKEMVTVDFVQDAVVAAVFDGLLGAAPDESTDDPGVNRISADVKVSTQTVPQSSVTDDIAMDCHESFFTIGGVQLYHWTVCTTTTDIGSPPGGPVHLEVRHIVQ